jgi:hypothetical protein
VHENFTRALAPSLDLIAIHVHHDQIVELDKALADRGRGTQNAVPVKPDADVAVVHRHPTLLMDQVTDPHDIVAVLLLRLTHAPRILSSELRSGGYN